MSFVFAKSPKVTEFKNYNVLSGNSSLENPRVIKTSSSTVFQENVNKFLKISNNFGRFITLHALHAFIAFTYYLGSYLGY